MPQLGVRALCSLLLLALQCGSFHFSPRAVSGQIKHGLPSDLYSSSQQRVPPPPINNKDLTSTFFPLAQGLTTQGQSANSLDVEQVTGGEADAGSASRNQWIARVTLLTVAAFYGTNFGCVKILDAALDPSIAASFRFSLAALVFLPYLLQHAPKNPKLIMGGLEVGLYSFLGYYAQAHSLLTSSASTAAFICSLSVIVVPLLEATFGSMKGNSAALVPWYQPLLPALLAAAGVGCLELGGSDIPGVGDLWAFAQPLCFGMGFWRVESFMKNSKEEGEAQAFTGAMMAVVAVSSFVWAAHDFVLPLLDQESGGASLAAVTKALKGQTAQLSDWHVGLSVLWTGIVTTAITSYGENIAMKSLSSSETTVIFSTEPLWGTAFAALALGESIGQNVYVGAIFILAACVWSSAGGKLTLFSSALSGQTLFSERIEEMLENISANWAELFGAGSASIEDKL